jgi:hypothetical protein
MPDQTRTKNTEHAAEVDPVAFFDNVSRSFEQVVTQTGGTIDRHYNLHGHVIRLRFAGPALIPRITPALGPWVVEPEADPELTICLWDDASTGTTMPPPPWTGLAVYNPHGDMGWIYTRRGEVRGYNTDRIRTAFHMGSDVLCTLDMARRQAFYWTPNAKGLPQWETGSPLRTVLHWWLSQFRLQFVHAGAVGTVNGGVLLVGKGGSGKSTTCLTCLNSDLLYVADDYCMIATQPTPTAYNLYSTGKVRSDNLHRVPHLRNVVSNTDRLEHDKALFFLDQTWPDKLIASFPLKAILVPRITGQANTHLSTAPATAALSSLSLSTMNQLPGAGPATLKQLKQLVDSLPCYYLELGTELTQIPQVISNLLEI